VCSGFPLPRMTLKTLMKKQRQGYGLTLIPTVSPILSDVTYPPFGFLPRVDKLSATMNDTPGGLLAPHDL